MVVVFGTQHGVTQHDIGYASNQMTLLGGDESAIVKIQDLWGK